MGQSANYTISESMSCIRMDTEHTVRNNNAIITSKLRPATTITILLRSALGEYDCWINDPYWL